MVDIRELGRTEMRAILPLVEAWNAKIAPPVLAKRLDEMLGEGFRCAGAFEGGELVGIAGFWVSCRFWCGRHIDLDNLVVDEAHRGQGIGRALIAWVEAEGRRLGCDVAGLDTYTENTGSQRLYERLGYKNIGYHYIKPL